MGGQREQSGLMQWLQEMMMIYYCYSSFFTIYLYFVMEQGLAEWGVWESEKIFYVLFFPCVLYYRQGLAEWGSLGKQSGLMLGNDNSLLFIFFLYPVIFY